MPVPTLQTPANPVILTDISGNVVANLPVTTAPAATAASTALSGTIATSGATVAIPFVSTARQEVINPSASTLWASWATPTVNGAGSFPILANGSFSTDRVSGTLTILSTVASQVYTVNRYS